MRITFICDTLKVGGPQRVMVALANEFVVQGHCVDIVTVKDGGCDYKLNSQVKHIYNKKFNSHRVVRIIEKFFWYREFLMKNESDCIISFYYTININLMVWKALGINKKIIISERNDPNNEPKNVFLRKIRNLLYRRADGIVYQTDEAEHYYSNCKHIPHDVIPNPMREDLPKRYEGKRKREIVNFCRITAQKNLYMLIDSFALIQNDYEDLCLKIYGDGPLKNTLEQYVQDIKLDSKIYFIGTSANVHEYVKDALMFVSTSNYEGISNSMMEALAMGLPTICTDCPIGGARLMIKDGKNGLLVPVNDRERLVKAMKFFLDNPEVAEQIGECAYLRAKEMNANEIAMKWSRLIEKIVSNDV